MFRYNAYKMFFTITKKINQKNFQKLSTWKDGQYKDNCDCEGIHSQSCVFPDYAVTKQSDLKKGVKAPDK